MHAGVRGPCVLRRAASHPFLSPEKWRADIEQLVEYFPRGKRGVLTFCQADVTKPETLEEGAWRAAPHSRPLPASHARRRPQR